MKYLYKLRFIWDLSWAGVGRIAKKFPNVARAIEMAWYTFLSWIFGTLFVEVAGGQFDGWESLLIAAWENLKVMFVIPVLAAIGRAFRERLPASEK